MKIKIIGILICMLVAISGFASANINLENSTDSNEESLSFSKYFYIANMEPIDPEEYNFDFEIISFAIIIGNGEINRLKPGEMIRLHGPMFGIIINNFHIGIISDWSIIG
ncbi:MAG: hypothetical protein JSV67_06480 [Thermoplasmatales archaeon]|jgi:hypothetical protein|nr:MAG: hypothetical protein JSV67_06480 [Thermoplasmatales archaeon]